jgi:hypothetical protein
MYMYAFLLCTTLHFVAARQLLHATSTRLQCTLAEDFLTVTGCVMCGNMSPGSGMPASI